MLFLILFIVFLLLFIILIEIFSRKYSISPAISRKVSHIGAALSAFVMPFFLTRNEIILIGIFFIILLFSTRKTNFFSSIHSVKRLTFGEIFLPMGIVFCAALFLPEKRISFQFGVLIMGISDALASLVGERFGKHGVKIFGHRKSIEGSAAFFISSIIITLLFLQKIDYQILAIPIVLTVIELLLVIGLDNLILPIAGAYLIQLFL